MLSFSSGATCKVIHKSSYQIKVEEQKNRYLPPTHSGVEVKVAENGNAQVKYTYLKTWLNGTDIQKQAWISASQRHIVDEKHKYKHNID